MSTGVRDLGAGPGSGLRSWHWGALVVVCLVLFLPGFFTLPPFDRDEARFAQASRQMVDSGDYVNIRFQDEARLKKPVGIYWLQAASVELLGGTGNDGTGLPRIWPYRLPSLLGAIAAVLGTAWIGARLFGVTAGLVAALMLAGCVVLGVEARMAKTDAVLLATVVLAQGALARIWLERNLDPGRAAGWLMPALFWGATGLSILIKGPIGPMVSALTVLALGLSDRRFAWLSRLRPWFGLALVVALTAPWLVAITIASHGRFFAESIGHDLMAKVASGQEGKGLPPGYFLLSFWGTFAPFALPAALAAPWVWANRRDPAVAFCLAWLVPAWLVFELVPTKLLHYTLPTYPAIALLTARAAQQRFGLTAGSSPWSARSPGPPGSLGSAAAAGRWLRWWRRGATGLALVATLALVAACVALPWLIDRRFAPGVAALALGVAGLWGLALAQWHGGHQRRALAAALAGIAMWSALAYGLVLPGVAGLWLSQRVAERLAEFRPCPGSVLAAAGYSEPSLVFLAGTATRFGGGELAAAHLRADPACGLAVVQQDAEPLFHAQLQGLAVRPLAVIEGFNYSRGKRVTLTLYRAEHGP